MMPGIPLLTPTQPFYDDKVYEKCSDQLDNWHKPAVYISEQDVRVFRTDNTKSKWINIV